MPEFTKTYISRPLKLFIVNHCRFNKLCQHLKKQTKIQSDLQRSLPSSSSSNMSLTDWAQQDHLLGLNLLHCYFHCWLTQWNYAVVCFNIEMLLEKLVCRLRALKNKLDFSWFLMNHFAFKASISANHVIFHQSNENDDIPSHTVLKGEAHEQGSQS